MKVLIIPDVHGRKFWRKAISNNIEKVDKVVFLGDYLDPYSNEIEETPELMECDFCGDSDNLLKMLEDIVALKKNEPNKYVLLTGNHTDSYIWPKFAAGTRTDGKHYNEYHNFFLENLHLFNLVHIEDNVIFSHAGITEKWANRVWQQLEYPKDEFSSVMEIAVMLQDTPLKDFNDSHIKLISDISYYRWGDSSCGSCEWADIREHVDVKNSTLENLIPLGENGIYQVFGHTQMKNPLINGKWACLDYRKGFIIDTNTYEITEC